MTDSIAIANRGAIRILSLNRPEVYNSFNQSMGQAFQQALDDAAQDQGVRCVLITGIGKAFCAGQDLKEITAPDAPDFTTIVEKTYNESIRRITGMEKPVVAAVNGVAAGAGANLALACDLTVAKDSASFIQAFSKIGLIPDSGGTWLLPRLVGQQRANAMAYFGEPLKAPEAAALGLVYRSIPDIDFEKEVDALMERLAKMPTRGLGLTKKAFRLGWSQPLDVHLTTERDLQMQASQTQDYQEGVSAFLEKRQPTFIGK